MQHEDLKKGIFLGFVGNLLFVAFALVCLIYYVTYVDRAIHTRILEAIAYSAEIAGFALLVYGDYLLSKSIRRRKPLKVCFSIYILLEAVMMVLELNYQRLEFYQPYSLLLAIVHAVVCAMVCFVFLQLDPENVKWECVIGFCFTLIIAGMLGNVMGIRIYFSIMFSTLGFAVMFFMLRFMENREEIKIECVGDKVTSESFNSTLFDNMDKYEDID